MRAATVVLACLASTTAFAPRDAAKPLFAAQDAALAKIRASLPLEDKDYPASLGLDAFSTPDGGSGALRSWEAPGPANIAWCSDLQIEGDTTVASLTVWCAPLKDVPHLVCRTTVTPDHVDAFVDFRSRAEWRCRCSMLQEDGTSSPTPQRSAETVLVSPSSVDARRGRAASAPLNIHDAAAAAPRVLR